MFLGFAHSLRRRHIVTQEQMEEVVLACVYCHKIADSHGGQYCFETVRRVISERAYTIPSVSFSCLVVKK